MKIEKIFIVLAFLISLNGISQNTDKVFYKDVVGFKLISLNKRYEKALINTKKQKSTKLFSKILNKYIKGKYLSNYNFETIDNKVLRTDKINKSILLLTRRIDRYYNSEEIQFINEISKNYQDKLEIIILFWNDKSDLLEISKYFDKKINLVVSDKNSIDKSKITFNGFWHLFGNPSAYLINTDKKIVNFYLGMKIPKTKKGWNKATEINNRDLLNFIYPVIK